MFPECIFCLFLGASGSGPSGLGLSTVEEGSVGEESSSASAESNEREDHGVASIGGASSGCEHNVSAIFSTEREAAYSAMWEMLLGSEDNMNAAGYPGVPDSYSHSSLKQLFESMEIVYIA